MMVIPEEQIEILQTIVSMIIGAISTWMVQWITTRKSRKEKSESHTSIINNAAVENVESAQMVIDMLQEMMDEQEKLFDTKIGNAERSCDLKIEQLKTDNIQIISDFEASIISLRREKEIMSHEIVALTHKNRTAQAQIEELTLKMARKEDDDAIERKHRSNTSDDVII